jgi:hypothetical protein
MPVVYETESPHANRSDLGPYREADYDPVLETFEFLERAEDGFRLRLPHGAVYRSAAVPGLELDVESFWHGIPA